LINGSQNKRVSLIICTYDRKQWVEPLLESIARQTVAADEVIIVDASPMEIHYATPPDQNIILIRSDVAQLTYQKNSGLDAATGDFIFFLDDDLLLDEHFIEAILKAFEQDAEGKVGAISGYITNEWGHATVKPTLLMKTMKFLQIYDGNFEPGTVSPSGVFTEFNGLAPFTGCRKVDFVPGGVTAFRKEVFINYRPPLFVTNYGGEDKALSRMIANEWEMQVCGAARVQHFSAAGGARKTLYDHRRSRVLIMRKIQKYYGTVYQGTGKLRLFYFLQALRMMFISIIMLLSFRKRASGKKWFESALGTMAGSIRTDRDINGGN